MLVFAVGASGAVALRGADAVRWLPLLLIPTALHLAWRLGFERPTEETPARIVELMLAIFGLALLAKVILKPTLVGYSFALAVPGAVAAVIVLLARIPRALGKGAGDSRVFARASVAWLCIVGWTCVVHSDYIRASKSVEIGTGSDRFRGDPVWGASLAAELVALVERELPKEATLLVLPEGAMVNYQTRRENPTGHLNFLPPELAIFGEAGILRDLQGAPPDFVALVHRETPEYGLRLFGSDYGRMLLEWVRREYERVALVGGEPLRRERGGPQPGFELLERAR